MIRYYPEHDKNNDNNNINQKYLANKKFNIYEHHKESYGHWSQSITNDIKIRGPNYLHDRIKQLAGTDMFKFF